MKIKSFFLMLLCVISLAAIASADVARREGRVHWVIDGDTFDLETGERIRLIGINSPEYEPWKKREDFFGKEASVFAKKILAQKKVFLESDIDPKDKYGRTLAYVFLEDGTFVNKVLVEQGYAKATYYKPNGRFYGVLKTAQAGAKAAKKGMWVDKSLSRA